MNKETEEKCICGIEYDENGEPLVIRCKKHKLELEEKLRKEYKKEENKIKNIK